MITGGSPILNFRKPPCVYSIYNHTINATPETPPVSGAKLDDVVQPETAIHHGGCPQARLSVIIVGWDSDSPTKITRGRHLSPPNVYNMY